MKMLSFGLRARENPDFLPEQDSDASNRKVASVYCTSMRFSDEQHSNGFRAKTRLCELALGPEEARGRAGPGSHTPGNSYFT